MAFLSNKNKEYIPVILAGLAGVFIFLFMPYLAFRTLNEYENTRLHMVNGVLVHYISDNFSLINIYVIWVLLTFLMLALYVCARLVKYKPKAHFSKEEVAILSAMLLLSIIAVIFIIISAFSAGLDVYGEIIMFGCNILSLAGLAIGYLALRKIPLLSRSPN